jgi:hypothetical protein
VKLSSYRGCRWGYGEFQEVPTSLSERCLHRGLAPEVATYPGRLLHSPTADHGQTGWIGPAMI